MKKFFIVYFVAVSMLFGINTAGAKKPSLVALWTPVAVCEEGGWVGASGYNYPDSIGINRHNWFHFGGTKNVSPLAQIKVGQRIERYLHRPAGHIPDEPCGSGY